jgi:hypothetical protein
VKRSRACVGLGWSQVVTGEDGDNQAYVNLHRVEVPVQAAHPPADRLPMAAVARFT